MEGVLALMILIWGMSVYISQLLLHYTPRKIPPAPPGRLKVILPYQNQPLKNFKKNKKVPFHAGSCLW
jgi:hypothetical protein